MGVFIEPPFWALRYGRVPFPHAVSVLVTPAVAIATSSVANPTVLTTTTPHGLVSGDTVAISGHVGSTPAVEGSLIATVLTPTTLSVPVAVTIGGAGGTVTRTLAAEPLTLAEAKLHCRIETADEDANVTAWIRAARHAVEHDTDRALLTQTRDLFLDACVASSIRLPYPPLQSVTSVNATDTGGVETVWPASNYVVDTASEPGRVGLTDTGYWPTALRQFQPVRIRYVAGWATPALIPGDLVAALKLWIGWLNEHRQPSVFERQAYDDLIAPFVVPVVA